MNKNDPPSTVQAMENHQDIPREVLQLFVHGALRDGFLLSNWRKSVYTEKSEKMTAFQPLFTKNKCGKVWENIPQIIFQIVFFTGADIVLRKGWKNIVACAVCVFALRFSKKIRVVKENQRFLNIGLPPNHPKSDHFNAETYGVRMCWKCPIFSKPHMYAEDCDNPCFWNGPHPTCPGLCWLQGPALRHDIPVSTGAFLP